MESDEADRDNRKSEHNGVLYSIYNAIGYVKNKEER